MDEISNTFAHRMGWFDKGFSIDILLADANDTAHATDQCPNWVAGTAVSIKVYSLLVARPGERPLCDSCWSQPFTGHSTAEDSKMTEEILYSLHITDAQLQRAQKFPFGRVEAAGLVRELLGALESLKSDCPLLNQELANCRTVVTDAWRQIKALKVPQNDWSTSISVPSWFVEQTQSVDHAGDVVWIQVKHFGDAFGPALLGAADFLPQYPLWTASGHHVARIYAPLLWSHAGTFEHFLGFDQGHTPAAIKFILSHNPTNAQEFAQLTAAWEATLV